PPARRTVGAERETEARGGPADVGLCGVSPGRAASPDGRPDAGGAVTHVSPETLRGEARLGHKLEGPVAVYPMPLPTRRDYRFRSSARGSGTPIAGAQRRPRRLGHRAGAADRTCLPA